MTMPSEGLTLNRAIVLASGLLYWSGVWVQAYRVRRRIGRSPNVRPHGLKENLLWGGWSFVVVAWLALPFWGWGATRFPGSGLLPTLVRPLASALGVILLGAGYLGTLWCYAAMGTSWRMGINRTETTNLVTSGPYRFVRHPIYLCQVVMVAALVLLLPSALSLAVLVVQVLCVLLKAAQEESHLRDLLGQPYARYCASTGGWFPRSLHPEPRLTQAPPQAAPLKPAEKQPR